MIPEQLKSGNIYVPAGKTVVEIAGRAYYIETAIAHSEFRWCSFVVFDILTGEKHVIEHHETMRAISPARGLIMAQDLCDHDFSNGRTNCAECGAGTKWA